MGKMILVFKNGELVRQITYRSKTEATGNLRIFKKHGILLDIDSEPEKTGITYEQI